MDLDEIKELARNSANSSEFEPKRDEWHSHYYGFIFGMQEGLKLGQELPKNSVNPRLLFDKGIEYYSQLSTEGGHEINIDTASMIAKDYAKHVHHFLSQNEG